MTAFMCYSEPCRPREIKAWENMPLDSSCILSTSFSKRGSPVRPLPLSPLPHDDMSLSVQRHDLLLQGSVCLRASAGVTINTACRDGRNRHGAVQLSFDPFKLDGTSLRRNTCSSGSSSILKWRMDQRCPLQRPHVDTTRGVLDFAALWLCLRLGDLSTEMWLQQRNILRVPTSVSTVYEYPLDSNNMTYAVSMFTTILVPVKVQYIQKMRNVKRYQ
ncbi:hypothetical protein V8E53_001847 [Lactarius tabidus]